MKLGPAEEQVRTWQLLRIVAPAPLAPPVRPPAGPDEYRRVLALHLGVNLIKNVCLKIRISVFL